LPEGTGWVLDGFPVTLTQAILLEKAVSGYDEAVRPSTLLDTQDMPTSQISVDGRKPMRKSQLLSDPRPPPPAPPPVSGIDAVILLDITDEQCLLRAAGELQCKAFIFAFNNRCQ